MAKRKSTRELSGGWLSLFGLPFLVAGLFMAGLYFNGYLKWWIARGWEEVPCWIESAELDVGHGDDSDTYKAKASYRYVYQGRTYHGDRVSFHGGGDNIGDFQQNAHRELSAHRGKPPAGAELDPQQDTRPFRCYVNPEAPSESVLYRSLRWEMQTFMAMFALTFPAVGAGLVVGGIVSLAASRKVAELRNRNPGEPWKWQPQWATNTIPESASSWWVALNLYTLWSGVIVFTLIGSAVTCGAFESSGLAWLLMIFALPADAPESGVGEDSSIKHTWKLRFKVPGTAIDSDFEIPVFRTEKSPVHSAIE